MQNSTPREVWFIRHGESIANAGAVTHEASAYPLSTLGFRQAAQLADELPESPHLIIHSAYSRARQTAGPAISRFPGVPVEEWPVHEVQYLEVARCTGTTQDHRRELAREYWHLCDPHYTAPGAESFVSFIGRVHSALRALAARPEPRTFVFSHGLFITALAWLTLTRPASVTPAAMRHFHHFLHSFTVPNCAILPLFLHPCGRHSLGSIHVPPGIEANPHAPAHTPTPGL